MGAWRCSGVEGLDAGVGGVVGVWLLAPCCLVSVEVAFGHRNRFTATFSRVAEGHQGARNGQPTCEEGERAGRRHSGNLQ